jgi:hypothetical protein
LRTLRKALRYYSFFVLRLHSTYLPGNPVQFLNRDHELARLRLL